MLIVTIMVIITISTGCATPKRPNSPLATPLNRPNSVASRPHHVNLNQARHTTALRVTVWRFLGVTLIVVLAARIRLLGLPLERDEGEYAYTGQLLLQGIPPYQLAYSMKFPGTSVAYALLMSIFGDSITAIHGGLSLINLLTAGLILFFGRNLIFLSSASVPFLVSCLAFWKAGVFEKFWFWTIKYAGHYGSQVSIAEGFRLFAGHFWGALGTAWPIWSLAAIGAIVCVVKPALRPRASFLITFAFFSALAVCPGFYFRPHYFILLLPAVSLLAGTAVIGAFETFQKGAHKFRITIVLLFALCLACPLWLDADFFVVRPLDH